MNVARQFLVGRRRGEAGSTNTARGAHIEEHASVALRDPPEGAAGQIAQPFASVRRRHPSARSEPTRIAALCHCRERGRDLLERLALSCDGVATGDEGGGEHEDGRENVAAEDALPRPAFDQLAENDRRGDASEAGSDSVENRDGQCADF
jgi:hypothetical protein